MPKEFLAEEERQSLLLAARSTHILTDRSARPELYSLERLERYSEELASQLKVGEKMRRGRPLLPELKKNGQALLKSYLSLASAIQAKQVVSPASEWFVDNFHLIEDQLREIKHDLPENYYYELPKVVGGEIDGLPRVYAIALAIIAHTDSRLDADVLERFVKAFQNQCTLRIGELWAIPISLRVALVGQLRTLAEFLVTVREKRHLADVFADQLLQVAAQPNTPTTVLLDMIKSRSETTDDPDRAFMVQLFQRLRDQDPDVWPVLSWMENRLQELGTTSERMTQLDLTEQAESQVTIGNIISSMRMLSAVDWRNFVEAVSHVDRVLAQDPAQGYSYMDFQTRDRYRHVIEDLAKRSKKTEVAAAQLAVDLAGKETADRRKHVGYFLIAEGLPQLERACEYRPTIRTRMLKLVRAFPTAFYLISLAVPTFALLSYMALQASYHTASAWVFIAMGVAAFFPISDMVLGTVNYLLTYLIRPRLLPKMETEHGLPVGAATIAVIPTLLIKPESIRELIETIQVHYLGNQDPHLYFAILSDFADSDTETCPDDEEILDVAQAGINEMNARYAAPGVPRFFLFHRKRLWNASESKWMGWERKRGKLLEFNKLIRGSRTTSFLPCEVDDTLFSTVKYVITLDSDTQLPRDSARRLIGTIIHPLNQPQLDPVKKCVTAGYGILQPRIGVSLTSSVSSRFAHIYSGNTGLDIYTTAVSDVYQDLFDEGSFTGKGLYVVDAFESALEGRIPENRVLSHDLFEGSFARSALVTDVELLDDYPSRYDTYSRRQHRWVRGDWQIAQWILPRVPNAENKSVPNQLSMISRWKIFDNLRRSLVQPGLLCWLLLTWLCFRSEVGLWTLGELATMLIAPLIPVVHGLFVAPSHVSIASHFRRVALDMRLQLERFAIFLIFLIEESVNNIDAILRTFYRVLVSKKNLLEWVSFAQTQSQSKKIARQQHAEDVAVVTGHPTLLQRFPVLNVFTLSSVGIAIFLIVFTPDQWVFSLPLLVAWTVNPFSKDWLNAALPVTTKPLQKAELQAFRVFARRTWHFFETFVSAEDNWLAPDNYQEDPVSVVAHRTSPTNIGLQLLSTFSAHELGYLGKLNALELVERIFASLDKMQRYHGHFFNWYETTTLEPLRPRYISTVDSGNLAGHLLTVKQACLSWKVAPFTNPCILSGLADTIEAFGAEMNRVKHHFESGEFQSLIAKKQVSLDRLAAQLESHDAGTQGTADIHQFVDLMIRDFVLIQEHIDRLTVAHIEAKAEVTAAAMTELSFWSGAVIRQLQGIRRDLNFDDRANFDTRLNSIVESCNRLFNEINFNFLFNDQRKIFSIGFNVEDSRIDNSYYDLLASESRLTSFVAVAKGDVPQEHWFRLGRQLTKAAGSRALIAWTATMFEYLMPLIVMKRYPDTLLEQTYETVVKRQIEYGVQRGVPWGISESGYNARDLQLNYQYGPFGIPGLGLKRGLSDELVVSPYSTMLAAMIAPREALENLRRLENMGAFSRFGFYEAIDFTAERVPKKQRFVILKSFMAHHQGMTMTSLSNLLNNFMLQDWFHAEPIVQATQILLQERIPQAVPLIHPRAEEVRSEGFLRHAIDLNPRQYQDVFYSTPRTHLLSNGQYSVMITSAGSGYSRSGPIAINRWREDGTRDNWGSYFYIRNCGTGHSWSPCYHPAAVKADSYEATFAEDKVDFWRRDGRTTTHTEILVSPEDNVELRRISLTNHSEDTREFEVTSFIEVVLAPPADDAAHPAFSNLFVQTEFANDEKALLATRRRRTEKENEVWAFHVLMVEGNVTEALQYETDRAQFLGRGGTARDPVAMNESSVLSKTVGAVLDPIFSLRQMVSIPPGATARFLFATGVSQSRADALRLADKYHDAHIFKREADIAWTKAQVQLRHLNIPVWKAHIYQRLGARILYSDPSLRPRSHVLAQNSKTQSDLWAHGISGDLPIILVRINSEKDIEIVRELLHGHEYLRYKGLSMDLVILNEHTTSYVQSLHDEIQRQIRMTGVYQLIDKPGGVFVRRADLMPAADVILLQTVARVILYAERGTLEEQVKRVSVDAELPKPFVRSSPDLKSVVTPIPIPSLTYPNGHGGFSADGRSYHVVLKNGDWTPAPWINVIANSHEFGCLVSEAGSGYTWSANSRENRLTPWSNDAVSDAPGEVIYIRDEETGQYWNPTPLPARHAGTFLVTHGFGYSKFQNTHFDIQSDLTIFVALDKSIKFSVLKVKNVGEETRHLSVTSYIEWVLGVQRGQSAPFIATEFDSQTGAILAVNRYNNEFASRVAFASVSGSSRTWTCDRKEFLGRNGDVAEPVCMTRLNLAQSQGAGLDPCAAFQTHFYLNPDEEKEIIIFLGEEVDADTARATLTDFKTSAAVQAEFMRVRQYWDQKLQTVQVKTPDLSMDFMLNGWLVYQTLSCRLWGRSALYQSGGAYGFRDQLQDVMALVYSHPELARAQILRAASRQFPEGDVQHWWHPPTGRGVRTRISDDLLFLPYVVSFYVKVTGDKQILFDTAHFIGAPELEPGHDDSYRLPDTLAESATILEHCARAIDRSLKVGPHGLPLMGSGDWNDGMNTVGNKGTGESVWVAWFLYKTIQDFLPYSEGLLDPSRVEWYKRQLVNLKTAVEEKAWDGNWYRRAYFDDGTPLGSESNTECQIDSIAQSWSVISKAGDPERSRMAMEEVDTQLVRRADGLIQLFTPPFDKGPLNPGYIKGYLPGVRENGGQYTHAAIWTVMAFAELKDGNRASELYGMLNPINHTRTPEKVARYKVEPYVMAADIYGQAPHIGRGGWTWYTGSASWMYRTALENILGFTVSGDRLTISPCIPDSWKNFAIEYRYGSSKYSIAVNRDANIKQTEISIDKAISKSEWVELKDDGQPHVISVRIP